MKYIENYPKIFQPYEGNPNNVNWKAVPEGWYHIIEDMCNVIQSYCDSKYNIPNPEYVEGREYDRNDVTTHRYIQIPREQVTCIQVKQKFGGLRFYTNGHDNFVSGVIRMADHLCMNTCIICGSRNEVKTNTKGWLSPYCKDHFPKN